MIVVGKSIVKIENDILDNSLERLNEDSINVSEKVIAISDGAGGVGILTNKWSEKLVKNIPDKPFENIEAIDSWISTFWEDFYNSHIAFLKPDPWKIKKFETEGSAATLAALWQLNKNQFHYQSYGDTALFLFNNLTGELKIQSNLNSVNSFTSNPPLINWQTEKLIPEAFFSEEITLDENEEIILATDGIANYIHLAYLVYIDDIKEELTDPKNQKIVDYFRKKPIKDFRAFILKLKKSLNTAAAFRKLMKDWHDKRCLANDDYTVVFVNFD